MFLYQANRLEVLFTSLCHILSTPLRDPLAPEVIVVQNQGMARWLVQQLAGRNGIAANLAFPLPARFVYDTIRKQRRELPDQTPFDRAILLWRIYAILPQLCRDQPMLFSQPAGYIDSGQKSRKLLQLAEQVANLFDQYLVFRPDMLFSWEAGEEKHWQAELWRKLTQEYNLHRGRLLTEFHRQKERHGLQQDILPERVCLFGLSSLAPIYLDFFSRLSLDIPVHLLHLSPCRVYWEDIVPERSLAKKRRQWQRRDQADISASFTEGNPLLASMGTIGRTFFRQLMELDIRDAALYETNPDKTLLALVQNDILELSDRTKEQTSRCTVDSKDISIQFHCCHSPLREVQVLHDRLLDIFSAEPDLSPGDILVMAPDISRYSPYIDGVFSAVDPRLRIPWSIADRRLQEEYPAGRLFLELLDLLSGRCTAPEVLALLENPMISRRFNLGADGQEQFRNLINESCIRWGLDQKHREQLGLGQSNLHTWSFGRDRLLLTYLMGEDTEMFADISPMTIGGQPEKVGALSELLHQLTRYQKQLQRDHRPDQWCILLSNLAGVFFLPEQDGDLLPLYQAIGDFGKRCRSAGFSEPLDRDVIRAHFEHLLSEPVGGHGFLAGQVTFCNMVPMRSIPFKVICLLGMNDTDYPRSTRPPLFDLMAQAPRLGDRNRRDDDRYLFLEALLSARTILYISWVGRSQQENTEIQPSVVVAELRDYLDLGFSAAGNSLSDDLTRIHPLQPFSRRCFDSTPGLRGYNRQWVPAEHPQPPAPFLQHPLPEPDSDWYRIDIGQLAVFWVHPVRFFLQNRLGLQLFDRETIIEENEPFTLDGLERYLVQQNTVSLLMADQTSQEIYGRLLNTGHLPHGPFAENQFTDVANTAKDLANQLQPLMSDPQLPIDIDQPLGRFQLTGRIESLVHRGRVSWRASKCKGKDLMKLWLFHLGLHLGQPEAAAHSFHLATDGLYELAPVNNPQQILVQLLELYWQGLSFPLHFYAETSRAYAQAEDDYNLNAAFNSWNGNMKVPGEQDDRAYSIALRGCQPLDQSFTRLALTVYRPLFDHLQVHESS